jgi:hypothetical protein
VAQGLGVVAEIVPLVHPLVVVVEIMVVRAMMILGMADCHSGHDFPC